MFVFGTKSKERLEKVHPKLVEVITRALALSPVDFTITEGVRTLEKQKEYYAAGKSQTMNSRHLPQKDGFSHAVDVAALVDGKVNWDWKYYEQINDAVQQAAKELGVKVKWGGTFVSLRDGVHWELG